MDPVAQSTLGALRDIGLPVEQVRTLRKYWFKNVAETDLKKISHKLLANDSIEQVVIGPLKIDKIDIGSQYQFQLVHVPILDLTDEQLVQLSRSGG